MGKSNVICSGIPFLFLYLIRHWGAEVIRVGASINDVRRCATYKSTKPYGPTENSVYDMFSINKKDLALSTNT